MEQKINAENETKELIEKMGKPFEYKGYFFKVRKAIGKSLLKLTRIVGIAEIKQYIQAIVALEKKIEITNDKEIYESLVQNKELQSAIVSEVLMKKMEDNFDDYLYFLEYSCDGGNTYNDFYVKGNVQVPALLEDLEFLNTVAYSLFMACIFFIMQSRK